MRSGIGYDVHRLVAGRKLVLGGTEIPYKNGLLGHSDADVLVHAVCDALLGAAGLDDVGLEIVAERLVDEHAGGGVVEDEVAELLDLGRGQGQYAPVRPAREPRRCHAPRVFPASPQAASSWARPARKAVRTRPGLRPACPLCGIVRRISGSYRQ